MENNNRNNMQLPGRSQNQNEKLQTKKNLINQSNKRQDDYYKTSNSNNHSQLEAAEEFAIEEDMQERQHQTRDVQQYNTKTFYNRQHYAENRVVPKDQQFYKSKKD